MNCPIDNITLQMSSREGVEIDYCPTCRGVWLDRGELDKLIEQSAKYSSQPSVTSHSQSTQNAHQFESHNRSNQYDKQSNHTHSDHNQGYYKKKKENWLGELFDF